MIAMRPLTKIARVVLAIGLLAILAGAGGATTARANSPWWHLLSGARPTYLEPGLAQDEVQRLTVTASEGFYTVERPGIGIALLEVGETPEQVQRTLEEELYGEGNVQVSEGLGTQMTNPDEV